MQLPAGTVTFLFTDIEGSTELWERHGDAMAAIVRDHDALVTAVINEHGGIVFKQMGDGVAAAFADAAGALRAALSMQRALRLTPWPPVGELRVRAGVHTGAAVLDGNDYLGPAVNRCARVVAAGHGGQVVCTAATVAVLDHVPDGVHVRDLGEHLLRGIPQPVRLHQVDGIDDLRSFPPLRTEAAGGNVAVGIPRPRTSFVGRDTELTELDTRLAPGAVVTLTGMGGTGKTRLAVEAALRLGGRFPDGIHLVELGRIDDPEQVAGHVAQAVVGRTSTPGDPVDLVARVLSRGDRLLVLDNCEHLVDESAATVETLSARCPRLTVLATSREPLGISGEQVVRVATLPVAAARQLFADRATTDGSGDGGLDIALVEELCQRLDGIPLAIELAASRLSHLALTEVVDRLSDRFRLLGGSGGRRLPRQQTLRATLDWSFELLTEPEQVLFRRVAVFAGGWTLAAAETVCAGGAVDEAAVVDVLGRLVDRSLVTFDTVGARYRLLETVREYALDALVSSGEADDVRRRHLGWATDLVVAHERFDIDPVGTPPHPLVVAEQLNVSAALAWAQDTGDVGAAARIAVRMLRLWVSAGLFDEADRWLATVAASGPLAGLRREWATAAASIGALAVLRGDFHTAYEHATAALDLIEREGFTDMYPGALLGVAICTGVVVSVEQSEVLLRDAADAGIAVGAWRDAVKALSQLGAFRLSAGDVDGAVEILAEADSLRGPGGDDAALPDVYAGLAVAHLFRGDRAAALDVVRRWPNTRPRSDLTWWWAGGSIAEALLGAAEDVGRASETMAEHVELLRSLAVPLAETTFCVSFAAIEILAGDPRRGMRLLGAARRGYAEDGAWRGPMVGALYVLSNRLGMDRVGPDVARAERAAGRALPPADAVDDHIRWMRSQAGSSSA